MNGISLQKALPFRSAVKADIRKPSAEVIARLLKDSNKAIKHHRLYPNAAKHKSSNGTSRNEWMERAETSLIASCMRGASVTRNAQLVLLCTTSLYGSALSQYSRVKVPTIMLGGKPGEKIEFDCLGTSEGFGSFHFSKDSLRMMGMLLG